MKLLIIILSLLLSMSLMAKTKAIRHVTNTDVKEIVLTEDNTLILNEVVTTTSMGQLMQDASRLNALLKSGYPMYLYLYTPGGDVQAGLEFYDFAEGLNRPIHTITSFAASMGFQTVQQLGERYMLSNGILMSHSCAGGIEGQFSDGRAQFDSRYGLWIDVVYDLDMKTVERTNGKQTLQSYRTDYKNELWLRGAKAVKMGYADAVVKVSCDATLKDKTYNKEFDFMMFKVVVTFSKCPLNQNPVAITAKIATTEGLMNLTEFIAKGGKFGANCSETSYSSYGSYSSFDSSSKTSKAPLCTLDTKLTLEDITKAMSEKKAEFSKNLVNSVKKMN
jgi:ATP-dependent protease ClpP protease subunit